MSYATPQDDGKDMGVLTAQLEGVHRGVRTAWANLPIGAVVVFFVCDATTWPLGLAWLGLVLAVLIFRTVESRIRPPTDPVRLEKALAMAALGATASGLLWGGLILVLHFSGQDNEHIHVVLGLVVAGLSAGAVSSLGWYRPAYLGYMLALSLPLLLSYLLHFSVAEGLMSLLTLLFIAVMLGTSRDFEQSVVRTLRLQEGVAALGHDLAGARAQIETIEQSKIETLAQVSHELRTPLNGIIGFSELLRMEIRGALGHPSYRGYAEDIHRAGVSALDLVETIMDFARGEAGKLELNRQACDSRVIIEDAAAFHRAAAAAAGVTLIAQVPRDLPAIEADPLRLSQALVALVSNAIKFTPRGGRVTISAQSTAAGGLVIEIQDTGIGLTPEEIELAFKPFVRLHNAQLQGPAGTGLGLPFARRLIELHGGTLTLQSLPGVGTSAKVSLSVALALATTPAPVNGRPAQLIAT